MPRKSDRGPDMIGVLINHVSAFSISNICCFVVDDEVSIDCIVLVGSTADSSSYLVSLAKGIKRKNLVDIDFISWKCCLPRGAIAR